MYYWIKGLTVFRCSEGGVASYLQKKWLVYFRYAGVGTFTFGWVFSLKVDIYLIYLIYLFVIFSRFYIEFLHRGMQFYYFYSSFSSSSSYSSWLSSAKVRLDFDYSALFVVMLALLICLTIELVVGTYYKVLFIMFRFDNDIFIKSLLRLWIYSCSSISFSSPY